MNDYKVVNGYSFYSLDAFYSLSAMNLQVWLVNPKKPVPNESIHETQSNYTIGLNPIPVASTMIKQVSPIVQFRYHDTTASWNFFIFLIAIEPPAVRNGLQQSAP